jgi:hypothetical protein
MHLNPRRLEAFYEADRLKKEEEAKNLDYMAWMIGSYVKAAIASSISRSISYPEHPLSKEQQTDDTAGNNNEHETMSDGQKFALFMVKHNKARKNKA